MPNAWANALCMERARRAEYQVAVQPIVGPSWNVSGMNSCLIFGDTKLFMTHPNKMDIPRAIKDVNTLMMVIMTPKLLPGGPGISDMDGIINC